MVQIVVMAIVGLAGLVAGVFALRTAARVSRSTELPPHWRRGRITAIVIGAILGAASWPLTFWMGYPLATPEGTARIVGIPFFVAFFDSAGRDYVGPITLVGCLANCAFWFMVPQVFVAIKARRWQRSHAEGAA
jgi:hypothetical protein